MADQPVLMVWNGDGFTPASSLWAKRADKQFVVGERYLVEVRLERSEASHRSYFAQVREVWMNLPEHLAEQFPDDESLRKTALIRTGFYNERVEGFGTPEDALKAAALMRPMDSFAIIVVEDCVVRIFTAKSQDYRSMDKAEFQRSKAAVLDYLSKMIGVSPDELGRNAGQAA